MIKNLVTFGHRLTVREARCLWSGVAAGYLGLLLLLTLVH